MQVNTLCVYAAQMLAASVLQLFWLTSISSILWVKCLASYWSLALVKDKQLSVKRHVLVQQLGFVLCGC